MRVPQVLAQRQAERGGGAAQQQRLAVAAGAVEGVEERDLRGGAELVRRRRSRAAHPGSQAGRPHDGRGGQQVGQGRPVARARRLRRAAGGCVRCPALPKGRCGARAAAPAVAGEASSETVATSSALAPATKFSGAWAGRRGGCRGRAASWALALARDDRPRLRARDTRTGEARPRTRAGPPGARRSPAARPARRRSRKSWPKAISAKITASGCRPMRSPTR